MEKLSETKKRGSSADESDDKPKRQRSSGGDAIEQSTNKAFLGLSLNDAMAISAKELPKNHTDKERFAAASSCIATEILTLLFARKRRRSTGPVLYQTPRSRSRRVPYLKVPIVVMRTRAPLLGLAKYIYIYYNYPAFLSGRGGYSSGLGFSFVVESPSALYSACVVFLDQSLGSHLKG